MKNWTHRYEKFHFSWVDAGLNLICGFERVIFILKNQKKILERCFSGESLSCKRLVKEIGSVTLLKEIS